MWVVKFHQMEKSNRKLCRESNKLGILESINTILYKHVPDIYQYTKQIKNRGFTTGRPILEELMTLIHICWIRTACHNICKNRMVREEKNT